MKILNYIAGAICAICIFIIVMWTSIEIASYDSNFYMRQYEANNVFESIQISEEDLYTVTVRIIDYLRLRTDDLNLNVVVNGVYRPFFSQREIDHMVDVQDLFRLFKWVRFICVVIVVLLFVLYKTGIPDKWNPESKVSARYTVLTSTCIGIAFLVFLLSAMGIAIAADFDTSFTIFHEIFFFNDLWILNPSIDLLINIVPLDFFINITIRVAMYFYSLIGATVFFILFCGGIIFRRS